MFVNDLSFLFAVYGAICHRLAQWTYAHLHHSRYLPLPAHPRLNPGPTRNPSPVSAHFHLFIHSIPCCLRYRSCGLCFVLLPLLALSHSYLARFEYCPSVEEVEQL